MGEPTFFQDDAAQTARALEVVGASFANGMNLGGSNAPGIGINMNEGAIVGTPEQFTLLDQGRPVESGGDQIPVARVPQISQSIGGFPFVDRDTVPYPSSGGTEGTLPDGSARFGTLPTQAAKDADPSLDGTLAVFLGNCTLNDLANGWVVNI